LDNADNTDLNYLKFFPSGHSGCILMSTRVPECQQYNTVGYQDADFEKLSIEESMELLLKSAQILPEKWDQPQVLKNARKAVGDDCLGQHALAITQAGAFISQRLCTLKEYPMMFNNQRATLLKHRQRQAESQYGDVYATFEVSAKALKISNRQDWVDALELLNVLAFLHREGVPEEMFTKAWTTARETTQKDPEDDINYCSLWHVNHMRKILRGASDFPEELDIISLRKARSALQSFSLVTIHPETRDISMHPLVHAWAKDRLSAESQTIAWATAASTLSLSIQDLAYHEFFEKIPSHIIVCMGPDPKQLFTNGNYPGLEIDRILSFFTWVMIRLRNDSLVELTTGVLCSRFGYEISLQSRNWRNVLYVQAIGKHNLAKYHEEIEILEKLVLFDKDDLLAESLDSLNARDLLGRAYLRLGKVTEAIELFEEVLHLRRKLLSPMHPNSLTSQHELAKAYLKNNQVGKAIELLGEVVQIREKTLAPTHPDRLTSQHELARAYLANNQVGKAIELLEEVIQIQEKTLAPTHPDRLASQHELARAYYKDGDYQKALSIIQEVVRIESQTLEPGNRDRVLSEKLLCYCLSAIDREDSRSGTSPGAISGRSVAIAHDDQASGAANLVEAVSDLNLSTDTGRRARPKFREKFRVFSSGFHIRGRRR
jgi:tetratricopeptide (TPR) repeat protein